jgi:hypothetical protein
MPLLKGRILAKGQETLLKPLLHSAQPSTKKPRFIQVRLGCYRVEVDNYRATARSADVVDRVIFWPGWSVILFEIDSLFQGYRLALGAPKPNASFVT